MSSAGKVGAVAAGTLAALLAIRQARADGLRPERQLQVSEWADAYRRLPKKSSAEPGPWRTDRTPYLREIMDCLSSTSEVQEVVFMKAAQVGGSEAILNAMGYVIDHVPGPMIVIQPTDGLAKRFSRQRIEPLIRTTPRIQAKVQDSRVRDSGNTMLSKEYPGGQLVITGANSAVGLRSMPAQYAFLDEIDGYPVDVDEEGSPLELVEARQRTFTRRKTAKISTPTIAGRSAIEDAYDASDQRRYYVPCPDCGHEQPLEFKQLTWTKRGLTPEQAVYECRACEYPIQEHQKTEMLAAGRWVAEKPERAGPIRGYHLNALYAPVGWMSWGDIARKYVKVHKDPEKYRVFINTVLGEVWAEKGDAPPWELLYQRRAMYQIGTCPRGVLFLTIGVDVQKDRLVYEVVGWGRGKRSWSIEADAFYGDTADMTAAGPWPQLDALLDRGFPLVGSSSTLQSSLMAVDSGSFTQTVYNWCRKYAQTRVIAVKGAAAGNLLIGRPSPVDVAVNGKTLKRAYKVWMVASHIAKGELYGWLQLFAPTDEARAAGAVSPPGYCAFPEYGEDYFKQLTGEQLISRKIRGGRTRFQWVEIPGRQNHFLDCRVYARAAASLVGLDRFLERQWRTIEQRLGIDAASEPAPAVPAMSAASDDDTDPPPAPPSVPIPPAVRPRLPRTARSKYLG